MIKRAKREVHVDETRAKPLESRSSPLGDKSSSAVDGASGIRARPRARESRPAWGWVAAVTATRQAEVDRVLASDVERRKKARTSVPRVLVSASQLEQLSLDRLAHVLVAAIDGKSTLGVILDSLKEPSSDVMASLEELVLLGVVRLGPK